MKSLCKTCLNIFHYPECRVGEENIIIGIMRSCPNYEEHMIGEDRINKQLNELRDPLLMGRMNEED